MTFAARALRNELYVSEGGFDPAAGQPVGQTGYLTIDRALDDAVAGDTVRALGDFTEDFSVPAGVTVEVYGHLSGVASPNHTLANGSILRCRQRTVSAGHLGAFLADAAGRSIVEDGILTVGDGGFGVGNVSTSIVVHRVAFGWLGAGSHLCGDAASFEGHVDSDYANVYATGAGAFAFGVFGAGQVVARIGHAVEVGGTLTLADVVGGEFYLTGIEAHVTDGVLVADGAEAHVVLGELVASNDAYDTNATGVLRLVTGALTGNRVGTADLTIAGETHNRITDVDDGASPYTALDTDSSINADASGGAVDVVLPSAVNRRGKQYKVQAVDITNPVRLLPPGAEEIRAPGGLAFTNALPFLFAGLYDAIVVESDGAHWYATVG